MFEREGTIMSLLLGFVVLLSLAGLIDGVGLIGRDAAGAFKRILRIPEIAALIVLIGVVSLDVWYTVQEPQWSFMPHTTLDWVLLLLWYAPALLWLLTLAVREIPGLSVRHAPYVLMAADLVWVFFSLWWLSYTLRFGPVRSSRDFVGVLEGLIPVLGLGTAVYGLMRRMVRRRA